MNMRRVRKVFLLALFSPFVVPRYALTLVCGGSSSAASWKTPSSSFAHMVLPKVSALAVGRMPYNMCRYFAACLESPLKLIISSFGVYRKPLVAL